jgi:hypothetical protein
MTTRSSVKRHLIGIVALLCITVPVSAAKVDGRLATVRKAYVVAIDDLGDDKPVAVCVAAHLAAQTPLTVVTTQQES